MIYYSNYFDLEPRQQSEDRPHRPGLKHNVLITDLEAEHTVDRKIINTLRNKHNVSEILTGDPHRDWI
jgi:SNF2 family DNA or RNA helicase